MPNHVKNVITFSGDPANIKRVIESICVDEQIDFEKLIPMPDNIYRGDLGQEEIEKYGSLNWYNWSIKNWGTKWNAYDGYITDTQIVFSTAWSAPIPIYEKLVEICADNSIEFKALFCDEDEGSTNCGIIDYTKEKGMKVFQPLNEVQARSLYLQTWGKY